MSRWQVRKVDDRELHSAFSVLERVGDWLSKQGRRQRISKTKFSTYQDWQKEDVNFAVFDGAEIAGIFSLPKRGMHDWPDQENGSPVNWLRALATDPSYRGKGVGELAIRCSLKLIANDPLYLDCVSDFLPDYYQRHGFRIVAQQRKTFVDETDPLDITLLMHPNRSDLMTSKTRST